LKVLSRISPSGSYDKFFIAIAIVPQEINEISGAIIFFVCFIILKFSKPVRLPVIKRLVSELSLFKF